MLYQSRSHSVFLECFRQASGLKSPFQEYIFQFISLPSQSMNAEFKMDFLSTVLSL